MMNDFVEELLLRSLRASLFMSPFMNPVRDRKKNVYWKVSVGLKCVQMSRIPAALDCTIPETSENQLLSEIILLEYHQLQNAPSGKRLSTQFH